MPVTKTEINHNEIMQACQHWVESGCPAQPQANVSLSITPGDTSGDPRESSFPSVSATVTTRRPLKWE